MTEFETQVVADLSALKSQMRALMGIGQPGRLSVLEERVEQHERSMQRAKGWAGALAALLTLLHLLIEHLRR